jgi:hypothetical protein
LRYRADFRTSLIAPLPDTWRQPCPSLPETRPEIRQFVRALRGVQADRGVFITTGRFTVDAKGSP